MTKQPLSLNDAKLIVWCECGGRIAVDLEDDGTISQRCDYCDRYIIRGTYTINVTIEEARDA